MQEILRFVYDYRNLFGRSHLLRMPLGDVDRLKLDALERLFDERWDPEGSGAKKQPSQRRFVRVPTPDLDGELKVGGELRHATLLDLGPGGAGVATRASLTAGQLTVLKLDDPASGRTYQLPARVVWSRREGDRTTAGLLFTGIPVEIRHASRQALALEAA